MGARYHKTNNVAWWLMKSVVGPFANIDWKSCSAACTASYKASLASRCLSGDTPTRNDSCVPCSLCFVIFLVFVEQRF